jgi:hypothetical protein
MNRGEPPVGMVMRHDGDGRDARAPSEDPAFARMAGVTQSIDG